VDSESVPSGLCDAFRTMQQQIEAAHATWITALVERRPELASQLWDLHNHYCDRHKKTEALLLLLSTNPNASALKFYAAYGALGQAAVMPRSDSEDESSEELNPHQKAALTKRTRTRRALLDAASALIAEGCTTRLMEESAIRAGVGVATVYNHFANRDELTSAVYTRLLESLLNQL